MHGHVVAHGHNFTSAVEHRAGIVAAFFTMNGVIAVVFFVFVAADLRLRTARP